MDRVGSIAPFGFYETWLLKANDYTTRTTMVPAVVSNPGASSITIVYVFNAGTPYPITGTFVPGSVDMRYLKINS